MAKPRIYVSLPYFSNEEAIRMLAEVGELTIRSNYPRPIEKELEELSDKYDVLIIGVQERMTLNVHSHCKRLRIIASLSTGLDHIDRVFQADSRFTILDTAGVNAYSVAEFALALILSLLKRLKSAHDAALKGIDRAKIGNPLDLKNRKIGIVGAGRTARALIDYLSVFSVRISCWTRFPEKHADLRTSRVKFVTLDELFSQSDIVSLHLPLVKETEMLLSSAYIQMLPRNAIVVNTARAGLVDNAVLFKSVELDKIFAVGIDDFPSAISCPIPDHPRIIVTPHIAGTSLEALNLMQFEIAKKVSEVLRGHSLNT